MTSFAWPKASSYSPTDVWIAFGDSMSDGRGEASEVPVGYPPGDGTLWMHRSLALGGTYAELTEPCGIGISASVCVGPWGLFGWLAQQETGRHTCVINGGVGGSLTSSHVEGQANYNSLIARSDIVLSRRLTTLRGILMYIGPNDAAQVAAPSWLANVQSTLASLRTRYGKTAAQCPCIFSDLTVDVATDGSTYRWWDATTAAAAGGGASVRGDMATLEDANHLKVTPPTPANRDGLHHKTGQNYTIAQAALVAAMSHGSWE